MTKEKEFEKEFEEWCPYGEEHKPFMKEAAMWGRQKGEEEREKELQDAIKQAQQENPLEVHCTCVPLLKVALQKEKERADKLKDFIKENYPSDHDGVHGFAKLLRVHIFVE